MDVNEFRRLRAGMTDAFLMEWLDISEATLRRWKSGRGEVPKAVELLLRIKTNCDLAALAGDDWAEFSFSRDGLFYHPFWTKGFTPWELKGMFFEIQDVWATKRDLRNLQREFSDLRQKYDALQVKAMFYRRQVSLESRFGLMLSRIAD